MVLRQKNRDIYSKTCRQFTVSLGLMSASAVGRLDFIDGVMYQEMYVKTLKQNLHSSTEKLGLFKTPFSSKIMTPNQLRENTIVVALQ